MALNEKISAYVDPLKKQRLLRNALVADKHSCSGIRFDCNDYLSLAAG